MKVCAKNRKPIAWLAAGVLDLEHAQRLRAHLRNCEGCEAYFRELSGVVNQLKPAAAARELEATEFFHRQWADRLKAGRTRLGWRPMFGRLANLGFGWRVVLPASAAVAVLLLAVIFVKHPLLVHSPVAQVQSPTSAAVPAQLAPSLSNYQSLANQSLEQFDQLLAAHARQRLAGGPVYRLSTAPPAGD